VTKDATCALASAESDAMKTSSGWPATDPATSVPAKVVLKALTTVTPGAARAWISSAAEAGARRHDERVERGEVDRVRDVDDGLAGQVGAVSGHHLPRRVVRQGQHDKGAGGNALRASGRDLRAKLGGQRLGLGRFAIENLQAPAGGDRPGADAAGHVAAADDGDVGHDVLFLRVVWESGTSPAHCIYAQRIYLKRQLKSRSIYLKHQVKC